MNKSESIVKIAAALSKFQAEVKNPANSAANPFFKSKYAPLDVVINTAKESLGKYGLSYIQMPGANGDSVTCTTIIMCEGEYIESDVLILKADKVTAQGVGSAITYARRYQLSAMLGLAGEEDDDGNQATGNGKNIIQATTKQGIKKEVTEVVENPIIDKLKVDSIKERAATKGVSEKYICDTYKLDNFTQMTVSVYVEAMKKLELRPNKKKNVLDGII